MDRCLHQQWPIVRAALYRAASLNRFVDGANRPTLRRQNDDYYYSIGRYDRGLKSLDIRAASVRWLTSFA